MENVRKHRNIKLLTAERRRIFLVSEPNNHTTVFFTKIVLAKEMRKTQILMNIGFPILDLSKTVMYEFWYATTATSVLIWVGNLRSYASSLLKPYRFRSSFTHSSYGFKLHNLMYLGVDVLADDMTIPQYPRRL